MEKQNGLETFSKSTILGDGEMTLRDYFAYKSLERILQHTDPLRIERMEDIAKKSYLMADAMIAERNQ